MKSFAFVAALVAVAALGESTFAQCNNNGGQCGQVSGGARAAASADSAAPGIDFGASNAGTCTTCNQFSSANRPVTFGFAPSNGGASASAFAGGGTQTAMNYPNFGMYSAPAPSGGASASASADSGGQVARQAPARSGADSGARAEASADNSGDVSLVCDGGGCGSARSFSKSKSGHRVGLLGRLASRPRGEVTVSKARSVTRTRRAI